MTAPYPAATLRAALQSTLAASDGLLLCLDFDGTLTPIAESPATPTITPANYRAVQSLSAHPHVQVAIISGRELADLRPRVGIPDLVYAGNHGLELSINGETVVHPEAAKLEPLIQRLASSLHNRLSGIPGASVENKRFSLTVHYRQVPPARTSEVQQTVQALTETIPEHPEQLRLVAGKQSLEIRPAVQWDKGDAVTYLMNRLPPNWRTVYIGDDTTDEDAFEVLGPADLGIYVGSGSTAASCRIPDQRAVVSLLDCLAHSVHPEQYSEMNSSTTIRFPVSADS